MSNSKRWLQEHFSDQYVKKAKQEGYASRAAYKLLELQKQERFIKPAMNVVDLGAAPGGWSQVVRELVGAKGQVIALDILPMNPIEGVTFIQGDFTEAEVWEKLLQIINQQLIDLVISDMAPNMSGVKVTDQSRSLHLLELALDCAKNVLKKGGTLLVKAFQGAGLDDYIKTLRSNFDQVKICKPMASRSRSSEIYLLARGYKFH